MSISELTVLDNKVAGIKCGEGYEKLIEYVHATYGVDQYKLGVMAMKVLTNKITRDDIVRLIKKN